MPPQISAWTVWHKEQGYSLVGPAPGRSCLSKAVQEGQVGWGDLVLPPPGALHQYCQQGEVPPAHPIAAAGHNYKLPPPLPSAAAGWPREHLAMAARMAQGSWEQCWQQQHPIPLSLLCQVLPTGWQMPPGAGQEGSEPQALQLSACILPSCPMGSTWLLCSCDACRWGDEGLGSMFIPLF